MLSLKDGRKIKFPYFLIISGPPATGKTSLGFKLQEYYKLPFIYKDLIKESLFDSLGVTNNDFSQSLGIASMNLLYRLLEEQLLSEKSVIIENAWLGPAESTKMKAMVQKYHANPIEIFCTGSNEIIIERFINREGTSERHKGHHRENVVNELRERLENNLYNYLGVNEHLLKLDTDDFSKISITKLIHDIEAHIKK